MTDRRIKEAASILGRASAEKVPPEDRARHGAKGGRKSWKNIPPEERSRIMRERRRKGVEAGSPQRGRSRA